MAKTNIRQVANINAGNWAVDIYSIQSILDENLLYDCLNCVSKLLTNFRGQYIKYYLAAIKEKNKDGYFEATEFCDTIGAYDGKKYCFIDSRGIVTTVDTEQNVIDVLLISSIERQLDQ